MSFKFKSSGKPTITINASINEQTTPVTLYGLKFPFQFDDKYTFLKCNTTSLDQITDDLKLLIMTNYGERIGRYDYGTNLKELLTENSADSPFKDAAAQKIYNAVSKWMPFVNLFDLNTEVTQDSKYATTVFKIKLDFSVPQISNEIRTLNLIVKLF